MQTVSQSMICTFCALSTYAIELLGFNRYLYVIKLPSLKDYLRPPNKIGEYAEFGNITRDIVKKSEVEFLESCKQRIEGNGGKLKAVDVNKKEVELEVKEIKSLSESIEGLKEKFPGLVHMRVPVCNSAAPTEADFDIICQTLIGTGVNTPIIVSDQVYKIS